MARSRKTWSANDLTPGLLVSRETSGGAATASVAGGEGSGTNDGARKESSDRVLVGGKPAKSD